LPSLSISQTANQVQFTWPLTNGNGFTLYSTTNLGDPSGWSASAALLQTNGGQIVVTQNPDSTTKFYRLQR
jgi:hypothetical protein